MARRNTTPAPEFTAGTAFSGSQYKELLEIRQAAMKGFAEGTVDQATKNAARTAVRKARKEITDTGTPVAEWRELEALREDEVARAAEAARAAKPRKPRKALSKNRTDATGSEQDLESTPVLEEVPAPEVTVTETEDGGVQVTPVENAA